MFRKEVQLNLLLPLSKNQGCHLTMLVDDSLLDIDSLETTSFPGVGGSCQVVGHWLLAFFTIHWVMIRSNKDCVVLILLPSGARLLLK